MKLLLPWLGGNNNTSFCFTPGNLNSWPKIRCNAEFCVTARDALGAKAVAAVRTAHANCHVRGVLLLLVHNIEVWDDKSQSLKASQPPQTETSESTLFFNAPFGWGAVSDRKGLCFLTTLELPRALSKYLGNICSPARIPQMLHWKLLLLHND